MKTATPGSILPGGIVILDEPDHCGVATFAATGEVLLNFDCRPGGNVGQIIIGLSANQALQLIDRLQTHADACKQAVANGKGGASFRDSREPLY